MRRRVGAVGVAELAGEAEVDDLALLGGDERRAVAVVMLIDGVEQAGERRAEIVAAPAAGADVVDPLRFGGQSCRITELRRRDLPRALHSPEAQALEPLRETTGVRLLGLGQRLEPLGDLVEPLVARRFGKARI